MVDVGKRDDRMLDKISALITERDTLIVERDALIEQVKHRLPEAGSPAWLEDHED